MIINYLHKIGWLVGLVLVQVLILNHIHLFGYATPFLYIYLILKIESGTSRNGLMLWAFFLGLAVDMFSNTPGMNAAATVALAFFRPFILRLFTPRDMLESIVPSSKALGTGNFIKYVVTAVFIHHLILGLIEYFSFTSIWLLLLRVVACSLFSIVCILSVEGIRK